MSNNYSLDHRRYLRIMAMLWRININQERSLAQQERATRLLETLQYTSHIAGLRNFRDTPSRRTNVNEGDRYAIVDDPMDLDLE
ncbi:hypothetical protein V8C44DRAFT_333240 [Trichoderma aethiopicum]